jgi:hypothetical protein
VEPGRGIGRDIAADENVERQIDAFIQKRHSDRVRDEGERAVEKIWRASERREEERRRQEEHVGRIGVLEHLHGVYARRAEEISEILTGMTSERKDEHS